MDENIKVGFLGGVGQFGMNLTYYESGNTGIIVDCGSLFAQESEFIGVDYIYPDFTYILENKHKFKHLIITHAHEDHIGAISNLAKILNIKIIGTKFTNELIKSKLREATNIIFPEFENIEAGERLNIGDFEIEFIHVSHSIILPVSLCIRNKNLKVIHTSDFKIDKNYPKNEQTDLKRLKEISKENVDLLIMDSTNANVEGDNISEIDVKKRLKSLFKEAKRNIFITLFASNIERIRNIIEISKELDKKVVLLGRSLLNYLEVAQRVEYLTLSDNVFSVEKYRLESNEDFSVFIVSGSQGETFSALYHLAFSNYQKINIEKNDTFIFSTKVIPGNEKATYKVMNEIAKKGAELIYSYDYDDIHASGHATSKDLKEILKILSPKYFIPFHGEYRQLLSNKKIGISTGIKEDNILIPELGDQFVLSTQKLYLNKNIPVKLMLMDGTGIDPLDPIVIKERDSLKYGFLIVSIIFDKKTFKLLANPTTVSKGFIYDVYNQETIKQINDLVKQSILTFEKESIEDLTTFEILIKRIVKKYIKEKFKAIPHILIITQYI